jgi:hypothetical protein
MTELLGRACLVAVSAEAADVAVIVRATQGERHDMVRHGGCANDALGSAVLTDWFSLKATQTLDDRAAPTHSCSHLAFG